MQAKYPFKIQAIRSKNQQARLYVYFPLPLAAAIGLGAGEEVQWELLDRGELHLVRNQPPQVQATQRATHPAEIRCLPKSRLLKPNVAVYLTEVAHDPPVSGKLSPQFGSAYEILGLNFLFAQVVVDKPLVDTSPNCGNILSGVGPFAIERGLVKAREGSTTVRVRTLNTGTIAELVVSTPAGVVSYQGEARIDGVSGTSAPILVNFVDIAGSVCGALLPAGHTSDVVEGIRVTCIDNGMPVVLIPATSVGRTGYEGVAQLNADTDLKARLEALRRAAGPLMGLGDVSEAVIPKLSLIAPPRNGGTVSTRSFIPRAAFFSERQRHYP